MSCPVYDTLSQEWKAAAREADRAMDPGAALAGAKLAQWRTEARTREATVESELKAHSKSCAVCLAEGRPKF